MAKFNLSQTPVFFFSFVFTFFLLFSANYAKAQVFVDASRPDDSGNGLSLANAKQTIDAGISVAAINDNINISAGSYAGCTLNKSVNFVGAGIGATIIQGASAGNGINIITNLTNVTIQGLTVTGFVMGINATTAGTLLTNFALQNVSISGNTTHGLFISGANTDGLTVNNSFFNNNIAAGTFARGIWLFTNNGNHTNITISNTQFNNNGLVGFDLAPHNTLGTLNISGCEARNNGDAGFSLYSGLTSTTQVIVRNNIVEMTNNQRFGMEIKNMVGNGNLTGAGSVVVSDNYIFKSSTLANNRDVAGIAIICRRSGIAGYAEPSGVVIINNSVENIIPNSATNNAFGVVAGGQNHKILNNKITGCEIGLQLQGGNTNAGTATDSPSATANTNTLYFDRDNSVSCNGSIVRQNNITGYINKAIRNVQNSTSVPAPVLVDYTGNFFGGVTFPIADIESRLVSDAGVAPTFGAFASVANSNAAFNPWAAVDLDDTAGNLTLQRGVQILTSKTYRAEDDVLTRITTALLPIQQGINIANPLIKDVLDIRAGNYPIATMISITKPIELQGDGGFIAAGVRPMLTSVGSISAVLRAEAQNITIDNLHLKVDGTSASASRKYGVFVANHTVLLSYDNLIIKNNFIENIHVGALDFFSFAIGLSENGNLLGIGSNNVTITNNTIFSGAGNSLFGRGVRSVGNYGLINTFTCYYGMQLPNLLGGNMTINNNLFNVVGEAGVEINIPRQNNGIHTISNNTFTSAIVTFATFSMIEIKDNGNTAGITSTINITGNTFTDVVSFGVFAGRSRNINISNNNFTPKAANTTYNHIQINTKFRTTNASTAVSCDNITIKGNTFNANAVMGGTGIVFANHFSGVNPAFTNVSIGGNAGSEENNFSTNIAKFISLDPFAGNSSAIVPAIWAGVPNSTTIAVAENFDAQFNNFDVGAGLSLPSVMSNADLIKLEDKISHRIEYQPLGFVTVKPNHVFVTQNSVLTGFTTSPRIQRGTGVPTIDGFTINVEGFAYVDDALTIPTTAFNMNFQPVTAAVSTPNWTMNGTAKTLTLLGDLTINTQVTFTDGNINTNANTLIFGNLAIDPAANPVANGEKSASRIIGQAQTTRAVGVGALTYLGVDIPAGADLGNVTLLRTSDTNLGVTGIVTTPSGISIACNWLITPQFNVGRNNVSFNWLPDLNNGKDLNNLSVWRLDNAIGSTWTKETADFIAPTTSPLVSSIPVSTASFSRWTISDLVNPLPLTWLYVRASLKTNTTANTTANIPVISWATVAEVNTAYFDVERSIDGRNFEKVGAVDAKGSLNQNNINEYAFDDLNAYELAKNVLYYRLRQVDKNNIFTYSRIVSVNLSGKNEDIFVENTYPNPTNGIFNVNLNLKNTATQSATMHIFDTTGKILKTHIIKNNFSQFDLSNLPAGMYYLVFSDEKQTKTYKIVRN